MGCLTVGLILNPTFRINNFPTEQYVILFLFSQSMHLASDPAHTGGGVSLLGGLLPPAVTPGQPMPNPAITKLAS